jgi:hypothetical protein
MAWWDTYMDDVALADQAQREGYRPPSQEQLGVEVAMEDPSGLMMGSSQAAGAAADPRTAQGQRMALDELQRQIRLGSQGILTPEQRAAYEQQYARGGVAARGAQGAYMDRMQSRGQGGVDTDILASQMGQQQEAQRRHTSDMQMQAQLADRTRQAQQAYFGMSSDARAQSFDESFARGQAADRVSMFDTSYAQDAARRNTDRQSEQSARDASAQQQWWENYLNQRDPNREAGNIRRNYNNEQRDRERDSQMWQTMLDTAGNIAGSYMGGGMGGGRSGPGLSTGYMIDEDEDD